MKIGRLPVGPGSPPVVVAELSGNHNGSLRRALRLVEAAAQAGAQAIKLQTYTAQTITLPSKARPFRISDRGSLWRGSTLHRLYQRAHTPWAWHKPIFARAKQLGLACFSTPFDFTAVDFLESLKAPAYKIASFEITHLPLIARVAQTGKPMLLSTGMATVPEIQAAVRTARSAGCRDLLLLKCTSSYPADVRQSNLLTLPDMQRRFGAPVGVSDHTLGLGAAVAAVALGACLLEKHLCLSREEGGVDAGFSLEPAEMRQLVEAARDSWLSRGKIRYGGTAGEESSRRFRRSIFLARSLRKNEKLRFGDLLFLRPRIGIPVEAYRKVLGRKLTQNLGKHAALQWRHLAPQSR